MVSSCPTCRETVFDGGLTVLGARHVCPPLWLVRDAETQAEDAQRVYAYDPEAAAEKWAEENDAALDYAISDGSLQVCVSDQAGGTVLYFDVKGEPTVHYRVTPV